MLTDVTNLIIFSQLFDINVTSANLSSVGHQVIIQVSNNDLDRFSTILERASINIKEINETGEYYKFGVVLKKEKGFGLITIPINTFPSINRNLLSYYRNDYEETQKCSSSDVVE